MQSYFSNPYRKMLNGAIFVFFIYFFFINVVIFAESDETVTSKNCNLFYIEFIKILFYNVTCYIILTKEITLLLFYLSFIYSILFNIHVSYSF